MIKLLKQLHKTIIMSYICLKHTWFLRKVLPAEYSKLNDIKYDFTQESINFLKLKTKLVLKDNINPLYDNDNYMFIINHRSLLDIILVENTLNRLKKNKVNNFWIAKEELKKMFIFGSFFKEVKSNIFIDRESTKSTKKMLKESKMILSMGNANICIFPEGTRNKTEENILKFKKGSEVIAKMNKMKIVNIFINENTNTLLKDDISERTVKISIDNPHTEYDKIELKYAEFVKDIASIEYDKAKKRLDEAIINIKNT